MRKAIPVLLLLLSLAASIHAADEPLVWEHWSDGVFKRAKAERKFVILDLEAVWCHWCHVMAEVTYKDPQVVGLLREKYITVRVDQDANPDISVRYEDWGWPATIVFAPDGTELVKRQGYIPPKPMVSLLDAIIKDPTPGPSVQPEIQIKPAEKGLLADAERKQLEEQHRSIYDREYDGWGRIHKFIDAPNLEYAIFRSQAGDKEEEGMARRTLDHALNLLDAEWGGFYQYSDERDWKSPHYEKIMSIQAAYIRMYAMAGVLWNEPRYLVAARKTEEFIANFWLSPEDAFYPSQDADVDANYKGREFYALKDKARRKLGRMPHIDDHVYARENGWMIEALAALYSATGEQKYLDTAIRAADRISKIRSLPGGGFRHDAQDRAGPFLGDAQAMGRAFLGLYEITGDRQWLARSEDSARFIIKSFKDSEAGFITTRVPADAEGAFRKPVRQIEENTAVTRWFVRLFHYTGKAEFKTEAEFAMMYLASPALIQNHSYLSGILLANQELNSVPLHIVVVGGKDKEAAKALYLAALRYPSTYRRVEWYDKREGALPNNEIDYPELDKPAAYGCTNRTCSQPFFTPEAMAPGLARLMK